MGPNRGGIVRASAASRAASAYVMALTSASSAIARSGPQIQLCRRLDDRLDLVCDGADLHHQRGRQHDHADRFAGVLTGDRQQPRRDELRRLFALDQCDSQLA
jgi:hypothetical protein